MIKLLSKEKATKLGEACLNEMYKKSEPPITWTQVKKKYGGKKIEFFLKHELSMKDYDKIKAKYVKKMGKFWARQLDWLLLDYAPKFRDEDVLKKVGK